MIKRLWPLGEGAATSHIALQVGGRGEGVGLGLHRAYDHSVVNPCTNTQYMVVVGVHVHVVRLSDLHSL